MRPLEFLFIIALVLYTFVIWAQRVKHTLRPWMVWLFGAGLTADVSGTVFLCGAMFTVQWTFTLHTVSGLVSLMIMALHFLWALFALRARGKFETYFDRFSVYAWCLWLVAFISGIPLH